MRAKCKALSAKRREQFFKILRQGRGKLHVLPCRGVHETEGHGVEGLSFQMPGILLRAVDLVAQKRMTDRGHVDADLVGPAGLQDAFHIGRIPEAFQDAVMCHCSLPVRDAALHFFTV